MKTKKGYFENLNIGDIISSKCFGKQSNRCLVLNK